MVCGKQGVRHGFATEQVNEQVGLEERIFEKQNNKTNRAAQYFIASPYLFMLSYPQ
jgi:hypothetical protein